MQIKQQEGFQSELFFLTNYQYHKKKGKVPIYVYLLPRQIFWSHVFIFYRYTLISICNDDQQRVWFSLKIHQCKEIDIIHQEQIICVNTPCIDEKILFITVACTQSIVHYAYQRIKIQQFHRSVVFSNMKFIS